MARLTQYWYPNRNFQSGNAQTFVLGQFEGASPTVVFPIH